MKNRKLSRRYFLNLSLGAAAGSLVAACVPAPQPQEVVKTVVVEKEVEKEVVVTATYPPPPAGGKVKFLTFYQNREDTGLTEIFDWLDRVEAMFMEENPGWGIEYESATWDQVDQRAILDFAAGVDHDLVFSSPQLMAKHGEAGDYLDLTQFFDVWGQEAVDDLSWSPGWKAGSVNGKQLSVATGVHTRTNAYRRDLFEEAGFDPDKPLTTLEEVIDVAKATTRAQEDLWGLGMYLGPSRATIELFFAPIMWAFGGDIFDAAANKASVASEAGLQAAKWLYDAVHTHKVTPPYAYAADAEYGVLIHDGFLNGHVVQAMGYGSYWIATLEDQDWVDDCWLPTASCTPGTAGVMVQPGAAKAQFTNSWNLSIHALSKIPNMAFKLLEVIMRPEVLKGYAHGGLLAHKSGWQAEEYSSEFYQAWFEAAQKGRPMPPTPYYGELSDGVAAALQEILANKADIEATLKKFEDEWNAKYAG